MVWGAAARGIDDLVERLNSNDGSLPSLCLLRSRRFNEEDARSLCDALAKNTVLVDLNITSYPISPSMATQFAAAIQANTTLHTLCLGNSTFGDAGMDALSPGIAQSVSLKHLDLEQKGITALGCVSLATALHQNPSHIHTLILSHNSIGNGGVQSLSRAVSNSSIEHLRMINCSLDCTGQGAPAIAACLSPTLKTLFLDNNNLHSNDDTDSTIEPFALQLSQPSIGLQCLSLSGCSLGSIGILHISKNLPKSLQKLYLNDVQAGNQGILSLSSAFKSGKAPNLTLLSIAKSQCDDASMSILINGIQNSQRSHIDLDLSCNTGAIGEATLKALSTCPTLRMLCLHDCGLHTSGAQFLINLLQCTESTTFQSLTELDLTGNNIESDELLLLLQKLSSNVVSSSSGSSNTHSSNVMPMPLLRVLVIAANPGSNSDAVVEATQHIQSQRPELMIVRRNADSGEQR